MRLTAIKIWLAALGLCITGRGIGQPRMAAVNISTDKAAYMPGEKVVFTTDKPISGEVKYMHLDRLIASAHVNGTSWSWTAPARDFTGYLVELYTQKDSPEKPCATIAVDVSSDPSRFPRNGFLSAYGKLSKSYMDSVMYSINRYHINYLQFQDWEYEHHKPLAGTPARPAEEWKDIGNRQTYRATVQYYIAKAHRYHILTLHYNLIYGALDNAAAEGVSDKWRLYEDAHHKKHERIGLPIPPFKSGLNIMNPASRGWQHYIAANTAEALRVYPFDGYQVDQMGNLNKSLFRYDGTPIRIDTAFGGFITAMKRAMPRKRLVMNAVSQYGQQSIAGAPVDFLYTEVWPPDTTYGDLARIIRYNDSLSGGEKKTVMPAYMDYSLAEKPGWFSTPGVVMTDAVIFAFGGAHLELGDHMLGKEYFPNANLVMHDDLKAAMVHYYDFLTAYENLLRDGGTFNYPQVRAADGKTVLNDWPPKVGRVSVTGKITGNTQVIHLINFNRAITLNWRDNLGTQPAPDAVRNPAFIVDAAKPVRRVWMASPDIAGGAAQNIPFKQNKHHLAFTLPALKYWDMVVVEYK